MATSTYPKALSRPRLAASCIEILESRIAPAFTGSYTGSAGARHLNITASISGNQSATITLSDANTLVLMSGATTTFDISDVVAISVLGNSADNGVTVDLSHGNPATPTRSFTFDGGGGSGFGDSLYVTGTGTETANVVLAATDGGTLTVGTGTYTYSSAADGLHVGAVNSLTVQTVAGADDFTYSTSMLYSNTGSRRMFLTNIPTLSIDLGANDGTGAADKLTVILQDWSVATSSLNVAMGAGNDQVSVQFTGTNPLNPVTLDGGAGTDTFAATSDGDLTLTNNTLTMSLGSVNLNGTFETGNLTGGPANNTFDISGWLHGGTIDGGGGIDTLVATNDASSFTLAATTLTRVGSGTTTLTNLTVVKLTGGPSANNFTVNNWAGTAILDGVSGADKLTAIGDYATTTLTPGLITRTAVGNLNFSNIPTIALTGGAGANVFNITGWTAALTITGASSNDTVVASNDVAQFTLTDTSLARTGLATVTLAQVSSANLTGGVGDNIFDVSGWNGGGVMNGSSGTDTLLATSDAATFTVATSSLSRTGTGSVTFSNVEVVHLTGGASANTFAVSGSPKGLTLDGQGGTDILSVTDDVASLYLSDTLLTRTGRENVNFQSIESALLTGGASNNVFDLSDWSGTGTVTGGTGTDSLLATNDIASFVLSTTQLTRTGHGALTLSAIEAAVLTGGAGDNSFDVSGWTAAGTIDGVDGNDTLIASGNLASFVLTDTQLTRTGATALTLNRLESALLTGGAAANVFTVSGWSGTGTVDGQGGSDTIVASNDVADFTLSDTALGRTDHGSIALTGVEVAQLTGGASANAFTVSGWSGTGTLDGGVGTDAVNAENDVAGFTLSDTQLQRTAHGALTLLAIEAAHLTGGASANTFTVSDWTGTGSLDGLGGSDVVVAANNVAEFDLSDIQLARTGRAALDLVHLEVANLTAGASTKVFDVSDWSGTGVLDGTGAAAAVQATSDVAHFVLSNTTLAREGRGDVTLVAIGAASLIGGPSANTFEITNWSGSTDLDGAGGTDELVTVNDVADFILSDSQLTRTGLTVVTLHQIESAKLTGGASANAFTVSDWSGSGLLDGAGGNDLLNATNDLATMNLSDAALARTGRGTISLASLEHANLTGGAGDNTFVVSGWTGTAVVDGANGIDAVASTTDVAVTGISDTQLTRTGVGTLTLAHLEAAALGGGLLANTFNVSGFTGTATLSGSEGDDVFNVGAGALAVTVNGGADDDLLVLSADVPFTFDGGTGLDTLKLGGSGLSLELPSLPESQLAGIEQIDIRGTGVNTLVVDLATVLHLSGETDTLLVRNDATDPVTFGSGWSVVGSETIGGLPYSVFTQGTATLKIEHAGTFLTIGDASIMEGASGHATLNFTVTRGGSDLGGSATVNYTTTSGTATAGSDFTAKTGVVSFAPGSTTATISIDVLGDLRAELDETFTVNLFGANGAFLSGATAVGTILNDDTGIAISADHKTATYLDLDGDLVTVKASKPVLETGDFVFRVGNDAIGGVQLEKLDLSSLGAAAGGLSLMITAKAQGGDGLVNVGFIKATGIDLGTVTVAGDLGRIEAGDGDAKFPAIKSLTVQSLGVLGLETQGTGGSLESHFEGNAGALVVKSDVRDATITATGAMTSVTIQHFLHSGKIAAGADIGTISIHGGITGSEVAPTMISAVGKASPPAKGPNLALKSLSIDGSVDFLRVLAGYNPDGDGVNADASLGAVTVGGDWRASTILAGVWGGGDGSEGTDDDALLSGGGVHDVASSFSSIGSFTVKGQALGTSAGGDMFGIVAEQITKAKIGGRTFAFTAKGAQAFYAAPTGPGEGLENPAFDFTLRELGASVAPFPPVAANLSIDATGKTATYTDVDGDTVLVKRSVGAFTTADFAFLPGTGGQLSELTITPAPGNAPVNVTITAKPGLSGGNGLVNLGFLNAGGVHLGTVAIAGDLGRLTAGDGIGKVPAVKLLTVQSLGGLGTDTQGAGGNLESVIDGTLGQLTVKSDVRGASVTATGTIGGVGILHSIFGGRISAGADLGAMKVGGEIVGSELAPVLISAVGKIPAPSKGVDTALKSLTVAGGVQFLRVLAGYDLTGTGVNADAAIGAVTIGGNWTSSTLLAGVSAGDDGLEGTSDDAKLTGIGVRDNTLVPSLVSQIAAVTIKGQVVDSSAGASPFGIIAEQINAAKIGNGVLHLVKGPRTTADFFSFLDGAFGVGEAHS